MMKFALYVLWCANTMKPAHQGVFCT